MPRILKYCRNSQFKALQSVLSISGKHWAKKMAGKRGISKPGQSESRNFCSVPSQMAPEELQIEKDPGQNNRQPEELPHFPHQVNGRCLVTSLAGWKWPSAGIFNDIEIAAYCDISSKKFSSSLLWNSKMKFRLWKSKSRREAVVSTNLVQSRK